MGSYNITATANGVTFSGSGVFLGTGSENIVLTATGTPTVSGLHSYTINTTPSCTFSRTVVTNPTSGGSAVVSGYTCNTASAGTMTASAEVSGVTQTITATVQTMGSYNITATANGVTFSGSGNFLGTSSQNIVLTASGTPTVSGVHSYTINTTPSCTFSRTVNPAALPANITLSPIGPHVVASVFDNDYLPYTAPTGVASFTTPVPADNSPEGTAVNLQGILTTTGVSIRIPYTVVGAAVNLLAFTQTMTIPAAFTEDGISRDVSFSYGGTTLGIGTGTITATLRAIGDTLKVKKLDIQTGVGNDNLGVLIAQFSYATNNLGGAANFQFRAIAGIPDRNFSDANHRMLYLPVTNPITNKTWLNNNLGANFSNTAKPQFNPAAQASSSTDQHAYGSFFQWGRYSDGHELINWTSSTAGTPVNSATNTTSSGDQPGHGLLIDISTSPFDWRVPQNNNLWQGASGINNPCPIGYRIPTESELNDERLTWSSNNPAGALASPLKLPTAGYRVNSFSALASVGTAGIYWSSNSSPLDVVSSSYFSRFLEFFGSIARTVSFYRANGRSVRCIRD
jgi:hypothetical protein